MSGPGNDLGMFQHPRFIHKDDANDSERSVSPCEVDPNAPQPFEPKLIASTSTNVVECPSATDDEQDLRTASSNNPTMIMELDMDGSVRYLSSNWNKIVGTKSKKIVGKPIANIIIANTPEDSRVFSDAISKMVADDCSYKVKFVTATGDTDVTDDNSTTSSQQGDGDGEGDGDSEDPTVCLDSHPSSFSSPSPPSPSSSSISSKLSNDGDIIELEAQGILMRNANDAYSMWTVKPVVSYNVDVAIPQPLIDILGAGSELFEGYLVQLRELGVANEEAVPPPKTILCRICENEIPAWFIERHSDLCIVEHRADDAIQEAHEALCEQRHLIMAITDSLAHNLSSSPSPLASSESVATVSSSSSSTSSFELIQEYNGIPLPTVPRTPGTVQTSSPLRPQNHQRSRSQLVGLKKFPFGLLARLADMCEEAIQINQPSTNNDGEISLSPPSKHHMMAVIQSTPMESSDPAMSAMIADTTAMVSQKVAAIERMVSALRYSERIKCQVDDLVLETVSDTLSQIRHQSLASEGDLSRKVSHRESESSASRSRQGSQKTITRHSRQGSVFSQSSNVSRSGSVGKIPTVANAAAPVTPQSPASSSPLSRPPSDRESRESRRQDPLPSSSLSCSRVYESPSPTQTGPAGTMMSTPIAPTPKVARTPLDFDSHESTPQTKLLSEFEYTKSVTPNDILQRSRPSSRPPSRPSSERSSDANLIPPSNSSSFSSPRRRMSPIPYGDKTNLSSLQRSGPGAPGSMIGGTVATPLGSPHISATTRGDSIDSTSHIPPLPPAAAKRTSSSGSGSSLAVASASLSKGQAKPPLSPLLVTGTPKATPSSGGIRDYTVVKPISKGAFGSVFLAKRKRVGEYVAIKCLKKTDMIAKNQIVNVKSERAVLMKQANSPYVTQLYSTFQSKEWLYLVMEYLPGGDLASLVKNLGTIGDWACNFIAQIVVCVDDLHRRDIIHRDLKPDNILIDAQGHLKLTDFGLSRMGVVGRQPGRGRPRTQDHSPRPSAASISWSPTVDAKVVPSSPTLQYVDQFAQQLPPLRSKIKVDGKYDLKDQPSLMRTSSEASLSLVEDEFPVAANPPTSITSFTLYDPQKDQQMSRFVGTPDYFAPETIKGEGQSEASDWWSIGCILFEFLFGTPPFHASTPDHVFANILAGDIDWPPLSPEDMDHYCPPEARDLITKLLVEDPDKRLGSESAEEIKQHPYFRNINWDTLFEEPGPFVPHVDDPESTDFFDPRGAEMISFPMDGLNSQEPESFEPVLNQLGASAFQQGRTRRGSRLADSSEFGSFYFRNLAVLEKANKDAINRLKNEHMEHRSSFSSTGSSVVSAGESPLTSHGSRQRESSFGQLVGSSPGANGSPFKRPISPVPPAPIFDDLKSDPAPGSGPPQIPPSGFSTTSPAPSPPTYKHERMESILSNYSSGDDLSFDKDLSLGHRHSNHPFNLLRDSPVTSDSEEPKSSALLRVHKRRQSYRRAASSRQGSFSADAPEPVGLGLDTWHSQFDVLYCEPSASVRASTTRMLERHGCLVVGVGDGDELVRRATGQVKFDLIMTCMRLTKVGAIEAAKLIKLTTGVNTMTPIVAVTAYGDIARESGVFDDVLDKPTDDGKIARCLARLVSADDAIESD